MGAAVFKRASHACAMAINFIPSPGMVLMCNFHGSVAPEIWKVRPIVIISSDEFLRIGLSTVVPLSTKRPTVVTSCHVRLLRAVSVLKFLEAASSLRAVTHGPRVGFAETPDQGA